MSDAVKEKYGLKGKPSLGLTAATFGFFIGFAAVALYGPAAKKFKDVMELSGIMLGFLVAIPQLTGSLLRIPFGAWVDRVGGKKPFLVLFILSIIGMAGLTFILLNYYPDRMSRSMYPLILFFGALSGCGVATFSVGIPQTSYWYPKSRQGFALGAYAGLGNTAPGFFTILLPIALSALGLPRAYALWFFILVAGTIIYAIIAVDAYYFQLIKNGYSRDESIRIAKECGQELIPSGQLIEALKKSARIGRTWALVALYFTSFGGFLALTTWFPTYWSSFHGVSLRMAGILTALCFSLLASFIRVYGGVISDKIGGEITAIMSFATVLLGSLILVFSSNFYPSLAGEILIGAGMGVANAAVFKLVAKYVPEAIGGASGWVGGLGAFGGFVVPPLLGIFVDKFGNTGYARGFVVYIMLAILSIGISLYLKNLSEKKG
jgi:NNP family nitrate/nitrite transporter-like MFS transporter